MKYNFLDVLCDILCAKEDEREIFLSQGGGVEWFNDAEMLIDAL